MAGKSGESLNLNKFSNDVSQDNVIEDPPSPILSSRKINRRLIINRKLNKQRSRVKLDHELGDEFDCNLSQCINSPETRLKAIDVMKTERKKYHDLLCKTNNVCKLDNINMNNQKHNDNVQIGQNHIVFQNGKKIYNSKPSKNQDSLNLQTASGKNIIIPEKVINECKYIFNDIFNDQMLDTTILKCPVQSSLRKTSKIPVLNRNIKLKSNVIQKPMTAIQCLQVCDTIQPVQDNKHDNTFIPITQTGQKVACSDEDFIITESFIEAAENIIEAQETPNQIFDFQNINARLDSKSMSKLYSNQKFEECSSSSNSLESVKHSYTVNLGSETSTKSSDMFTNTIESVPSTNYKGMNNNMFVMATNESEELSVMDIVNDDWSDTMYDAKSNTKGLSFEEYKKSIQIYKIDEKNEKRILSNTIIVKNNTEVTQEKTIVETLSQTEQNHVSNQNKNIKVENTVIPNCSTIAKIEKVNNNQLLLLETNDNTSNQRTIIPNSKSVIHVNIPVNVLNYTSKPPYSKNLIELHRNRNFVGHSEDSGSNIDYKFSEHSIQVKKKTVRAHKKMTEDNDLYGFDKNSQEFAKHKAIILYNNIQKLEKEINDREALAHLKNKEEKKLKDKKSKKYKSENGDMREKDNIDCLRELKVKYDRKKKDKLRQSKLILPVDPANTNNACEEITNEQINRTVTYDHISIISEQSCKKYKGHKRRKSVATDKEVVCQTNNNNNNNQVIQISPNQKKFKIEIDCNNKCHINICCNCVQSNTDKMSDKEMIKDVGVMELNCKAIENSTTKSSFQSASGKDILLNKKCLSDAERKYEETNSITDKSVDKSVRYNLKIRDSSKDDRVDGFRAENDMLMMNETCKEKFIKKFSTKSNRLYHNANKSDMLSNADRQSEKETTVTRKFISKLNGKEMVTHGAEANIEIKSEQLDTNINDFAASNFCGFTAVSGKKIKLSEKAIKQAQALYKDIADKSYDQVEKIDNNVTDLNRDNKSKELESQRVKQRTRVLYTDINNSDFCAKITVPLGYKLVSGKLVKDEVKKDNAHIVRNEANKQNNVNVQGDCNSSNKTLCYGFQSASGKNINISSKMLEKAKRMFDENCFHAGDASDHTPLPYKFQNCLDNESIKSFVDVNERQEVCNNAKLCMGDFKEVRNDVSTKTITPDNFERLSHSITSNASKKAFELLEDVVETVDSALEKIQKSKAYSLTYPRKRLGISKCKQMNISKERIDKAKRLFSNESFSDSIRDLSVLRTPIKSMQIGSSSTPLRNNMSLMKDVQFSKASIEAEITPIKSINWDIANDSNYQKDSMLILRKRTPGTIDDWHKTIVKQISSVKDTLKMLEEKKNSLEKQMSFVHYSNKDHRRQRPGFLYSTKTTIEERVPLKALKFGNEYGNTDNSILDIIPKTADLIHFNFACLDNVNPTKDGAIVIPNSQNLIGLSEIETAFQTMAGVEPELIPKLWIANHYRLIVWKLASYQRVLPQTLTGCLSIENIIQQLKYRYDREIDRAQRPAIRKILEKDDVPQKRMILCVSDIIQVPNSRIELELSDGWYCIRTIIDDPLAYEVQKKKIKIGTKLVIYGAQLLNCDGCHPLEVTDIVKLKISYNCTRRALWHAKLGYQKCPGPFTIPLQSVHSDGGVIGCIQVHIVRVYPIRYMEQIDNRKVWRNRKAEEKYSNIFENERLEKIEKIHYTVQEKFERDLCLNMKNKLADGSILNRAEISKITCPQVLFSLVESSHDPEALIEILSPSQRVDILEYRQQLCLQREQEISKRISEEMDKLKLTKRKVVPILKLLVLDDYSKSDKAQQFCIWNPNEDDMSLLKEGISLTVYNVVPRSNGDLFSNTKTYFRVNKTQTKLAHSKFKRNLLPISLVLDPHYKPIFNEFDTIGLVVQVNITTHDQELWISDAMGKMLFIKIKDGPEVCSLLDGVAKGHIISVLNLIYCNYQQEFGQALANQFTTISNFSQQNYLQEQLELFKTKLPEDLSKLLSECERTVEKYKSKIDLQQKCFITCFPPYSSKSLSSSLDICDDSTLMQSRLTATDIAMSLIDTDKLT